MDFLGGGVIKSGEWIEQNRWTIIGLGKLKALLSVESMRCRS